MNKINTVEQFRIPDDKFDYSTNRMINGAFYPDWNRAKCSVLFSKLIPSDAPITII